MRIEPFDPKTADDDLWRTYLPLVARTHADVYPIGFPPPDAYLVNTMRNVSPLIREWRWLAWDGDELAGAVELSWWEAKDNRHLGWMHYEVLPENIGDGLLDALYEPVAETMREAGRTTLTIDSLLGDPIGEYVAARGGKQCSAEQNNVAPLVRESRADLAAIVAAVPDGYEAFGFDGPCPEDLIETYARLVATMNTAPRDDMPMEDIDFSPERIRAWEAGLAARGHTMWTVGAREVATGELAAFTQVVLAPEWPEVVEQEDTAVAVPHRGHGLGLWVKARNLLRLLDEAPEARRVSTWNAESNAHMIRVNRRLGFVCEHHWLSWELGV